MQIISNRYLSLGLLMAAITAVTATLGTPTGLKEFTVPVWDILFQFNLCSAFIFVIAGVLQTSEVPLPDLRAPMQMLSAAFFAYQLVCLSSGVGLEMAIPLKLFLFALSIACIVAGLTLTALAALRQLDNPN
jgi:hypothetical protein